MRDYYAAAICPRGHVYAYDLEPSALKGLHVGCDKCGLQVLTECPTCRHRIRGGVVPTAFEAVLGYEKPEFCDNPECRVPHPWASRQASIYALENLLDGAGLSGDQRKAVKRELRSLASEDLEEDDETERWKRIKTLAPRLWSEGKPIIYSLLTEAMKRSVD